MAFLSINIIHTSSKYSLQTHTPRSMWAFTGIGAKTKALSTRMLKHAYCHVLLQISSNANKWAHMWEGKCIPVVLVILTSPSPMYPGTWVKSLRRFCKLSSMGKNSWRFAILQQGNIWKYEIQFRFYPTIPFLSWLSTSFHPFVATQNTYMLIHGSRCWVFQMNNYSTLNSIRRIRTIFQEISNRTHRTDP